MMFLVGALGWMAAGLAGCGPEERDKSLCEEKSCAYGVCEASTGQCVNASPCRGDIPMSSRDAGAVDAGSSQPAAKVSDCLQGYSCVSGACRPDESCDPSVGNTCSRGICEDGACVNQPGCTAQEQCIAGFRCDEGLCTKDKCVDKTCERGSCQWRTGKCVNEESCSPRGISEDCAPDYTCLESSCVTEEELCRTLDCQRGKCSFQEAACVNRDDCKSDRGCAEGFYCTDAGNCEENKCDSSGDQCPRGICKPSTGKCANPDRCTSTNDCKPMHRCVENSCVATADACREGGCPGNMVCDYDANQLTAECKENSKAGCQNALDCTGDRVCKAGNCGSGSACMNDGFETNNSASNATDYFEARQDGLVEATVCSGDVDRFTFDSSKDPHFRGELQVKLSYDPVDVGIGDLNVKVIQPDGKVWLEETAGQDGEVLLEGRFGADMAGVYTIVVEDAGDVHQPGVGYELTADIIDGNIVDACQSASTLQMPTTSGNTISGNSVAIDATCVDGADAAAEDVYSFELTGKSYVQIDVDPKDAQTDMTAALRSNCPAISSEVACADSGPRGATESIDEALPAGTYYLIVQGPDGQSPGAYDISYSKRSAVCTQADDACVGQSTAQVCSDDGSNLRQVNCQNGCNAQRGECNRINGDACFNAIDANGGISGHQLDWNALRDDFDAAGSRCLAGGSPATDGSDAVFSIEVPANHVLTGEMQLNLGQNGSLYLLNQCQNSSGVCEQGVDSSGSTETLVYENDTSSKEQVFVIADSSAGSAGTASLSIQTDPIVCKQGDTQCQSGSIATCNKKRTGYAVSRQCPAGCNNAGCTGDVCTSAFDATGGGTWQIDMDKMKDDANVSSCLSRTPGKDAVFKVTANAGEVIQAKANPGPGDEPALFVTSSCMNLGNNCLAASDSGGDGNPETLNFAVPQGQGGTYYVWADANDGDFDTSTTWTIDITVKQPVCTVGTSRCKNATTLEYCANQGLNYKTYSCKGSNPMCTSSGSTARCNNPTGDICPDPIPVQSGDTKSGTFSGTNHLELSSGSVGQCNVGIDTDGEETIYSVNLGQSDLLRLDLQTSYRYAQVYVMGSCTQTNSCQKFERLSQGGKMYFQAPTKGTYFVVIDSYSTSSGSYQASFDITPNAACIPNSSKCSGSTAQRCNSTGSGFTQTYNCSGGCQKGVCQYTASTVDSCMSAPTLSSGTITRVDMSQTTDTTDINSCVNGTPGHDAVFKVQAQGGQVIKAEAVPGSGDEPAIYITRGCSNPGSSCVAGSDSGGDGNPESLSYKVPAGQGGTYAVWFDANDGTFDTSTNWDISIQVASPICQPGQVLGCDSQQSGIRYCSSDGLTRKTYACSGSSQPLCASGKCRDPKGGQCIDPIPVTDGTTDSGSFTGSNSIELSSGTNGSCNVGTTTDGNETIYEATLQKGALLTLDLQTNYRYAQVYVMGSCGDGSTCQKFERLSGGGTFYYKASKAERVYLVVDSYSTGSGSYNASFSITNNAVCIPNSKTCQNMSTAAVCASDGSTYDRQISCGTGCTSGYCSYSNTDLNSCSTAPSIGRGTVARVDMSQMTDGTDINSCVSGTPGNDAVFEVTAQAGDTILATATPGSGDEPALYITKGCMNPGSSCVAGSDIGGDGNPESISYTVPQGQSGTYYVWLDANDGTFDTSTNWDVDIEVKAPVCQAGTVLGCTGSDTLEYCSDDGLSKETYSCQGSTSPTCSSGSCTNPTGDVCFDAKDAGKSITDMIDMSSLSDDVDINSCISGTPGHDAVYEVTAQAGEIIEATATPGTGDEPAIFITPSCADPENGCVAGSDSGGDGNPETITYKVPQGKGGTYYVWFDANDGDVDTSTTWSIDIKVSAPVCQAGTVLGCSGPDTLEYCSSSGLSKKTYTCQGSTSRTCNSGVCQSPTGDVCVDPITVSGSTLNTTVDMSTKADDVSVDSCLSTTPGHDVVYEVNAMAGQKIDVTATPGTGDEPAIFITSDCGDVSNNCVAGSDSGGDGNPESISYTVPQGKSGTYYIWLDADDGTFDTSTNWTVDIKVQ